MIKVSDYLARRLHELGVNHVFMVTGGGAMHLNDSFARVIPFRVIFNHHEQACAMAAEGLWRTTGKVAIVNVTSGPGGLNALTGVLGQWTDSIPAIYVSGQVKQSTTVESCKDLGLRQLGDQEVDIIPIVKSLVKFSISIRDPQKVRWAVEKAFYEATSGRMGPVWIDVPMDIQGAMIDEATLEGFSPANAALSPLPLNELLGRLKSSKRPVVVAGHGIRLAGQVSTLHRLLAALGVPALATFNGFDLLPNDSPYYCGRIGTLGTRGGNFTLQNADFVLFLGSRNNVRQVSYNWENFARNAFTAAVDIDGAELRKPTFSPNLSINADLRYFMPEFTEAVENASLPDFSGWLAWSKERTARYPVVHAGQLEAEGRIHPYPFFDRFTRALPTDATVVAGNGTACVVLFQAGVVCEGQRYFWNSGCASMGFDLPAAIGAAVGMEGADVWCLAGDGSLQMNLQELSTVGYHRLPVKLVYIDNGGYASIRQTQSNFFQSQYGCGVNSGLAFPSMEKLALAFGIPYVGTARLEDLEGDMAMVRSLPGPVIWGVNISLDYAFEPKLSSAKLPDGRIVSKPLEDMYPFLPREEFDDNMLP